MRRRDLVLATLVLLVAWQLLAWLLHVEVLPGPWDGRPGVRRARCRAGWLRHFLVSAWRVRGEHRAGDAAGRAGRAWCSDRAGRWIAFFAPIVYIVYPIPKIVFLPVILLLLGIGDRSKIFIIFLILFFQILVVVRDQASALRPELIYSVRSLGAGRRALFRFVYLPATVPAALTALRVSVGHGDRRAVLRRVVCHHVRPGLLHHRR